MVEIKGKGFQSPDEVREFKDGKGRVELVDLNGHMIGRGTFEAGWRWSEHVKPLSGTDSCQVEHIGYVLEGEMTVRMDDGSELRAPRRYVPHAAGRRLGREPTVRTARRRWPRAMARARSAA